MIRLIRTVNGHEQPCGWWPDSKRADLEAWIGRKVGQHRPYRIEEREEPAP